MKVLISILSAAILITGAEARRGNTTLANRTKVIGGSLASISKYPYQLSLVYTNQHICGASIISEKWAVTAAHCLEDRAAADMTVRCGSSIEGVGGAVRQVKFAYPHPKYDFIPGEDNSMDYDLALLEVVEEFPISDECKPIEISQNDDMIPEGIKATVTGWGRTSDETMDMSKTLQMVQVPIIDRRRCQRMYQNVNITKRMICAGYYLSGGKDACQGDSGGPMVIGGKLVGVISWGYGCALAEYPGVYSNVAAMRDFVNSRDSLKSKEENHFSWFTLLLCVMIFCLCLVAILCYLKVEKKYERTNNYISDV